MARRNAQRRQHPFTDPARAAESKRAHRALARPRADILDEGPISAPTPDKLREQRPIHRRTLRRPIAKDRHVRDVDQFAPISEERQSASRANVNARGSSSGIAVNADSRLPKTVLVVADVDP